MAEVPFKLPDHAATVNGQALLTYPHRKLHVLVATTGSVASIKLWHIVEELLKVYFALLLLSLRFWASFNTLLCRRWSSHVGLSFEMHTFLALFLASVTQAVGVQ